MYRSKPKISNRSAVIHAHGCCFDPSTCPGGFRRLKPTTAEVLHIISVSQIQVTRLRTQNLRNRWFFWDIDSWRNQGESTQNDIYICHDFFYFIISFKNISLQTFPTFKKKNGTSNCGSLPISIQPFVLCLCLWDFLGLPRQLLRCRCCQSPRSPGRRRRPIRLRLVCWYGLNWLNQSMCLKKMGTGILGVPEFLGNLWQPPDISRLKICPETSEQHLKMGNMCKNQAKIQPPLLMRFLHWHCSQKDLRIA